MSDRIGLGKEKLELVGACDAHRRSRTKPFDLRLHLKPISPTLEVKLNSSQALDSFRSPDATGANCPNSSALCQSTTSSCHCVVEVQP